MERGIAGQHEISGVAGEQVRAFVPHPLPPDPLLTLYNTLTAAAMTGSFTNPVPLGSIPEGWHISSVGNLCSKVTSGGTPLRSCPGYYLGGSHNWFKTQELKDGFLEQSDEKITDLALRETAAKILPERTVLMAMYGDGKTITSLGILRAPSSCNQACCAMIADPRLCDFRFLFYSLKFHRNDFLQIASGGAQRNLSGTLIRNFSIRVPPLSEQHAIAHILSTLDDKIELNRRMNETLEAMARAIFKSWFVDFDPVRAKAEGRQPVGMDAETAALFPDGFELSELGEVPKGWRVGSVYTISDVVYGAPFSSVLFSMDAVGLPLIRIRDLATQMPEIYTPERHPKAFVVEPGAIVVGMDGEFRVYLWRGPQSYINQRVCAFVPRGKASRDFVRFSIEDSMAFFERAKVGTTVIHLGKSDIDTFRILVSDDMCLSAFDRLVTPLTDRILATEAESRTLALIRDALLPKLLSGEIRVKDAEKFVASNT